MPDAPVALVAIAPLPSASTTCGSARSAGTSVAAPAAPALMHDLLAPSALVTEPSGAYATAPNDPPYVGIERNADLHLAEIERALTPDERVRMHAMINQLPPDERDVWLDKLLSAPPSQGTAMLRDALGEANAQPRTTTPPVRSAPVATASDDAPGAATQAPEHASAQHEPPVEITELDDTADLDDAGELDDTADLDDAADLDDTAEISELDATSELADSADRTSEPTRAADPAHSAPRADDATAPQDADPRRADRDARPTKESAPTSRAPGAGTADTDPGHHLAAIEAVLTLAEKMRAHELAAQRPAAELRRWYAELLGLSVPDAVAKILAELARSDADPRATKKGGAS
jgi:hypothetical protein